MGVSSLLPEPTVVVAGAGQMGEEHVKALLHTGLEPQRLLVLGRGRDRAEGLASRFGVRAIWGGVDALESSPALAIVAVGEEELPIVARALLDRGARRILVEKPGALHARGLDDLRAGAERAGAVAFVGYNRRFYPAVERSRALIEEDGGPLSIGFEFTEIEDRVLADGARRSLSPEVLRRWGIANSLHVIDLAFYLGGEPERLSSERAGTLSWHPAGAVYGGSGVTERGAVFAYLATWSGAGRWGVEVTTRERKLVLRPLEVLQQQLRGSFAVEPVALDTEPAGMKPGLAGNSRRFSPLTRAILTRGCARSTRRWPGSISRRRFSAMSETLAVVPARGGSKGLPGKNIRSLAGLPLIEHSLRLASLCPEIARTVVSTDSDEIAAVAVRAGGEVPFLRPPDLARDETPMLPVLRHALGEVDPLGARLRVPALCSIRRAQGACPRT